MKTRNLVNNDDDNNNTRNSNKQIRNVRQLDTEPTS